MTPPATRYIRFIKPAFVLLMLGLLIYCGWLIVSTIRIKNDTGMLKVSTNNTQTIFTASQPNMTAVALGVGSAKVRMAPGTYLLVGFVNGLTARQVVSISKGMTTSISLNPVKNSGLPTASDITFNGVGALTEHGLSDGQVANFEDIIFRFLPTTHSVTLNTAAISYGVRNLNLPSAVDFTMHIPISIDDTAYNGSLIYSDSDAIEVILTNPQTGAVIFDSGATTTKEGD